MTYSTTSLIDLLNRNKRQVQEALRRIAPDPGIGPTGIKRRRSERYAIAGRPIDIRFGETESTTMFRAYAADLSATGMGLLHGAFVHEGTKVEIHYTTEDGEQVSLPGVVTRVELVLGRVHHLGVHFDEVIDPTNFADSIATHVARHDATCSSSAAEDLSKHCPFGLELPCTNINKTRRFYWEMFTWQVAGQPSGDRYECPIPRSEMTCYFRVVQCDDQAAPVMLYVNVPHVEPYLPRAIQLGGKSDELMHPLDRSRTYAIVADPDGNRIALVMAA